MHQDVFGTLEMSFNGLWRDTVQFLPEIILALLVVLVGWLVGNMLYSLVVRVFNKLKVNEALSSAGADTLVSRTGYSLKAGEFVGALIKWFVIIVFFVTALEILHLNEVTVFFRDVVLGYLPRVIVAVLILLVAMVVANVASTSVRAGAQAAKFAAAGVLATVTRYAILTFAILAALAQLEIAPDLVEILFMGIVFAASLALGLSFGLGGKEAAARYISKMTSGHHHD